LIEYKLNEKEPQIGGSVSLFIFHKSWKLVPVQDKYKMSLQLL